MKTIFDKIDPKYLDCSIGQCEHAIHSGNGVLWGVAFALLLVFLNFNIRFIKK